MCLQRLGREDADLSISCRDILSLLHMNQLRVVAGDKGLRNEITWVHHLECANYIEWLKGGELVITTGVCTGSDAKKLCDMVEKLMEKEASGLIICLGKEIPRIPPELVAQCLQMEFPLFELSADVQFLDISKSICTSIVQYKKKADEKEGLLLDLIHGVRLSGKRLQKLNSIGITPDKSWSLICIHIRHLEKGKHITNAPSNSLYQDKLSEDLVIRIKNFIRGYLGKKGQQEILFSEDENIFWLMDVSSDRVVSERLNEVLYNVKVSYPGIGIHAGVGKEFSDVKNMSAECNHAMEAVKLGKQRSESLTVSFYEDMIAYQLFHNVSSVKTLEKMTTRILRELMLPDNQELLDTLIAYVSCDCSAKRTAETMFLHSNTMHYRLHKIEGLLDRNLKKSEDLFTVMLGVKLYTYIRNQS